MDKKIFVKHVSLVVEANSWIEEVCRVVGLGGDVDNSMMDLFNDMGSLYADLLEISEEREDEFYELFWSMVIDRECHYDEINSWEEFYDYFVNKEER